MHNVVLEITNKYVGRLPEHEEYLFPDDLARYGIPDFVIERVRSELKNNLIQSLSIPETDWADMSEEQVEIQWNAFLEKISGKVRLPLSYAGSVFENCIDDIISVLSEPRTYIPELLFGERADLFRQEVKDRSESIVVFTHLAHAIPRFMQRKDLDTINRERANQIVARIDERLTEHFSPLNWAQHLDPLFILTDNQVDPDLIRCFFEDKGRQNWANRFDREQEPVTRSRFIEILSAPDTNYYEDEGPEPDYSTDIESQESSLAKSFEQKDKDGESLVDQFGNDERKSNLAEAFLEAQDEIEQDTIVAQEEDTESKIGELSAERFFAPEEDEIKANTGADTAKDELVEEQPDEPINDEQEPVVGEQHDPESPDDTIPIWKRFAEANSEEDNILKKYNHTDTNHELSQSEKSLAEQLAGTNDSEEYNEKPIIDLVNDQKKNDEHDPFDSLYRYVEDQENRFTDELFGGDNNSFVEAIKMIAEFKSWSDASKYISSEIFRRNMINIYSETAIDFTDRLQTYFIEKK